MNSIQEKVREMRLRWFGHMQRMEENNEVRAVGDQEGDGWIASEGICRHCGSPRRMPRTEHSGNQEFGPLTARSGKRRRKRRRMLRYRHGRKTTPFLTIFILSVPARKVANVLSL